MYEEAKGNDTNERATGHTAATPCEHDDYDEFLQYVLSPSPATNDSNDGGAIAASDEKGDTDHVAGRGAVDLVDENEVSPCPNAGP